MRHPRIKQCHERSYLTIMRGLDIFISCYTGSPLGLRSVSNLFSALRLASSRTFSVQLRSGLARPGVSCRQFLGASNIAKSTTPANPRAGMANTLAGRPGISVRLPRLREMDTSLRKSFDPLLGVRPSGDDETSSARIHTWTPALRPAIGRSFSRTMTPNRNTIPKHYFANLGTV